MISMRKSRLSVYKQDRLVEHFVSGSTARTAAALVGVTEITGYRVEDVLGKNPRTLKSGYTTDEEYAALWTCITSGDNWAGEFHNRRKDGSFYWASSNISPIFNTSGEITHFIGVQEDITEKRAMQEELENMATLDALTGVLNRRRFFELLESEQERSRRFGHCLSLLMVDVDHFKKINDDYGHQKGDQVLIEISNVFSDALRQSDLLGRFGGEEFIIALPETDLDEAGAFAERIRSGVEATDFNFAEDNRKVTVSIGVGGIADKRENLDELISRADRALYEAKKTGRNRIIRAEK